MEQLLENKMPKFSLTVEAAVRGHRAYMEQQEAAVDTTLYFERELGECNDSLDSAADDNLLESKISLILSPQKFFSFGGWEHNQSKTNNKGQPFFAKNSSMIRPYLGGSRTFREPKNQGQHGTFKHKLDLIYSLHVRMRICTHFIVCIYAAYEACSYTILEESSVFQGPTCNCS